MKIVAQLLGIGAMISLFLIYQQPSRKRLLAAKLSADLFWTLHYLCLGAFSGLIPNFLGIFREIVFLKRDKNKMLSKIYVPIFFIFLNFAFGIAVYKEAVDLLPIVASSFVTVALWLNKPNLTKIILLPVSVSFLIYDVFVNSYVGVINEILSIVSMLINFIKVKKADSL